MDLDSDLLEKKQVEMKLKWTWSNERRWIRVRSICSSRSWNDEENAIAAKKVTENLVAQFESLTLRWVILLWTVKTVNGAYPFLFPSQVSNLNL